MFDLSKITNALSEWKDLSEKNRLKNLRAEIASKEMCRMLASLNENYDEPHTNFPHQDGIQIFICKRAVQYADLLLKELGEKNV